MTDPTTQVLGFLAEAIQDDCDDVQPYGSGALLCHREGRSFLVQVKLAEVDPELVDGFGAFGLDERDSAALLKLRRAIDEHLPEWQPEAEAGDYEGLVRNAGRVCELARRWRSSGIGLAELADAVDDVSRNRP